MTVLWYLVLLYLILLIIRMVFSWIRVPPSGPWAKLYSLSFAGTEPVLRPLRNAIPPVRMGAVGLDLSATVLFIVLFILLQYLPH